MTGSAPPGERRQDLLTGAWVVVAPHRGHRPVDVPDPLPEASAGPDPCPFCPGGEAHLGPIVAERAHPDGSGWITRAVQNRYPAFIGGATASAPGTADARFARGHQEVLVETPDHHAEWAEAGPAASRAALDLYLDRLAAVRRDLPGHRVFVFRNRGRDAGCSRAHPHGQLVAVDGVPPQVARLERRQRRYHRRRGACLLCEAPRVEPEAAARTVLESPHFRVSTLWAPADPFHLRIVPRRHVARLPDLGDEERADLASLLPGVLRALRDAAGDPAWNLLFRDGGRPSCPWLHAHLEIRPRFSRSAGFELLTAVALTPSDPVQDAAALRRALAHPSLPLRP